MSAFDEVVILFQQRGGWLYLGEPVTQLEHALQTASFAEAENASSSLVAAALLHDIGHLLVDTAGRADAHQDFRHEIEGAVWLARRFPAEVRYPIRLHVAAKRYLCHADSRYENALSTASRQSLELQGGSFTAVDAARFLKTPFSADAIRLRHWDDLAKVRGRKVPGLEHYRKRLEGL